MSETKHTPGPWRTSGSRDRQVFAAEGMVADCACQWADDDDEDGLELDDLRQQQNASLVCAAPELLAALEQMIDSAVPNPKEHPTMWAAWGKARAALLKARGEQL